MVLGHRLQLLDRRDQFPDAKTVWQLRERLTHDGEGEKLFKRFDQQLATKGLIAKGGQMVDATFVEAPEIYRGVLKTSDSFEIVGRSRMPTCERPRTCNALVCNFIIV